MFTGTCVYYHIVALRSLKQRWNAGFTLKPLVFYKNFMWIVEILHPVIHVRSMYRSGQSSTFPARGYRFISWWSDVLYIVSTRKILRPFLLVWSPGCQAEMPFAFFTCGKRIGPTWGWLAFQDLQIKKPSKIWVCLYYDNFAFPKNMPTSWALVFKLSMAWQNGFLIVHGSTTKNI